MRTKILVVFIVTITFFLTNWLMDIYNLLGTITNGFFYNLFNLTKSQSYHLVWYMSIICFVTISILYIMEVKKKT